MELLVVDKTDDELRMEIAGEDHTFMNVLKGALLETEGVAAATYDVNPEQSGGQTDPILSVRTEDGVDPLDAVEEAAARIERLTDDFADAFRAAAQ
jgi:DNA-directed RNA polymerase subunit L